jgi:hypothetical protein
MTIKLTLDEKETTIYYNEASPIATFPHRSRKVMMFTSFSTLYHGSNPATTIVQLYTSEEQKLSVSYTTDRTL